MASPRIHVAHQEDVVMRGLSSLFYSGLAAAACLTIMLGGVEAKGPERGHRAPQLETSLKPQSNSDQTKESSKARSNEIRVEDIIPDICRGC